MDNFMDKIAQKLTSQDMIRANSAADAAELQKLETQMELFKEQMGKYDDCLQEMRQLNLKNIENAEGIQQLTDEANEKLGKTVEEIETTSKSNIQQTSDVSIAGIRETSDASIAGIKETSDASIAGIKQTSDASIAGIRQTSDVSIAGINQAVEEGLAKIAEIRENGNNIETITENMTELQTKLEESFKGLEDFLHTDNVKVYRNVQASMVEQLKKQTEDIQAAQAKGAKMDKMMFIFVAATLVLSFANLIMNIGGVLGLF